LISEIQKSERQVNTHGSQMSYKTDFIAPRYLTCNHGNHVTGSSVRQPITDHADDGVITEHMKWNERYGYITQRLTKHWSSEYTLIDNG